MLATHDSLTAYPVKNRLLRPFAFLSRCQKKTLEEQYAAGARSFDLRFARYRGKWYGAHGATIYDITPEEAMETLASLPEPVYFRVLCEDTFYRKSDAAELAREIDGEVRRLNLRNGRVQLKPLYVRSKKTFEMIKEFGDNGGCADYPAIWNKAYTPRGMAEAVRLMYDTRTTDDKLNFIACYSSGFIP